MYNNYARINFTGEEKGDRPFMGELNKTGRGVFAAAALCCFLRASAASATSFSFCALTSARFKLEFSSAMVASCLEQDDGNDTRPRHRASTIKI
eukprot:1194841-Prorocentrum_minimum.AAC.2